MVIKCPKCGGTEFNTLENEHEEFYYEEGTGELIKGLECDMCENVYQVTMKIAVTDVEIR